MRINGLPVYGPDRCEGADEPAPGRYFLIRVDPQDRETHYEARCEPGRTNRSGEVRLSGWLGSTNNISRDACGAIEVYRTERGLRARRIDATALYDETSPDTTLADA